MKYVQTASAIVLTVIITSLYISLKTSKNNSDEPLPNPPISPAKNDDEAVKKQVLQDMALY